MELVRRSRAMKDLARQAHGRGRRIGFVPTMGALHEGHLTLVRRVRELTDVVVLSIFVNPLQFGASEDFDTYPRDLTRDADLCVAESVDWVFAPGEEEIYPPGAQTTVEVAEISGRIEGASRPGHFRGVSTVVLKLLEIVRPDVAAFGQKDAQQTAIIRRMVKDLMLDVEILVVPILRDEDGLALSSRNARMSPDERRAALAIPRALEAARKLVEAGQRQAERIVAAAREALQAEPALSIDYVQLVDPTWFEPVTHVAGEALLVVAAWSGGTRLIDNTFLRPA